jgi:adenylate cyclase
MEYTVIGDSVNVASRLQDRAKPGSILLSRRTYEAVRDLVDARSLGAMKVKGKEEEVEVYEVHGLCAA